ncbi:MAG TPA: energy transducer TonB [Vicinamibacterales bacterium]|nr:energy transducer TonB [Vicinamibacterales bacterium]
MAQMAHPKSEDSRSSPLHLSDRPVELRFGFEQRRSGVGVGVSVAAHGAFVLVVLLAIRFAPTPNAAELLPDNRVKDIVWLADPGPGGGGGGGGNNMPEPPRKAELRGREKMSVPVPATPEAVPDPPEAEPPPEQLVIPAEAMASAEATQPGTIAPSPTITASQGAGKDGGAGTGAGAGIGSGQGAGLGPGYGGGTGGGAYQPGAGITIPQPLLQVGPAYTADAMRARVQGTVSLECIVMPDGSVSVVKVTRSLDPIFGLDQEAIKAARQWRFRPGLRQGEPVPVIITIELTFNLR